MRNLLLFHLCVYDHLTWLDESKFLASCFQMCWDGGVSDTFGVSNCVQCHVLLKLCKVGYFVGDLI